MCLSISEVKPPEYKLDNMHKEKSILYQLQHKYIYQL